MSRSGSQSGSSQQKWKKLRAVPVGLSLLLAAVALGVSCSDQPTAPAPSAKMLAPKTVPLNVSVGDGPKIATDKQDYALGETVAIEGWDWTPGETVTLQVVHTGEGDNDGAAHQPFGAVADSTGYLTATWQIPPDGDEGGASLKLTADGQVSLAHAEVEFTDLIGTVYLFSDSYGGTSQTAFALGSTIYPQIRGAQLTTCYRLTWKDPSNATIGTPSTVLAASTNQNAPTFTVPSSGSGTYSLIVDQLPGGSCSGTFVSPSNPILFDVARAVVIGAGTTASDATGGDQCVYAGSQPAGAGCGTATDGTTWVRSSSLGNARTFVRFDLTGAVPSGATITEAKVRLTVAGTAASARTYEIRRTDASWGEASINNGNQPGVTGIADSVAMATSLVAGSGGGDPQTWVRWRVTIDVQGFVNGSLTNNGWRIRDANEGAVSAVTGRFNTTETTTGCPGVGTCKRAWPVLLVDYNPVTPDSTTVTTIIHKGDPSTDLDSAGVTSVPLGTTVHDKATIANVGGGTGNGTPEGTVAFTFWTDGTCGANSGSSSSAGASVAVSSGVAHPSTSKGPLAAGSYSFRAAFTSSDLTKWKNSVGSCEPLTVTKATPTLTTAIHKAPHVVVPDSSYVYQGTTMHDSGALTDILGGSLAPTGTIKYYFYHNNACSGTASDSTAALALPGGSESGAFPGGQPLGPGQYAYKAKYSGDSNYNPDTSDCEPFQVVPYSSITGGGLCTFDRRSDVALQQFNAIFTPEVGATTSKLNATNPGQFRFNVFYIPDDGATSLSVKIPAGFVTQGATPVHVYGAVTSATSSGVTCFTPSSERSAQQLTVTGASGGTLNVDITNLGSPSPKVIYIVVHVDYYWKNVLAGCTKQPHGTNPVLEDANCTVPSAITLVSPTSYTFGALGNALWNKTVQSFNVFKKDPGIGGLVLRAGSGDPVPNVVVDIYQAGKKVGTVTTDEDGWYMWLYKYTGKATTFTVKLPAYNLSQDFTLKSNGYGIVNFTVP